jgi:NAD(P)-dependent dehydrogenase (short-subunit alcohol dehydrogenase family)
LRQSRRGRRIPKQKIYTKSAAVRYGPLGIRVNSVHPGYMPPMLNATNANERADKIALTPLRRLGEPIEVAYGVMFLASDEASFVTGTELVIDGGGAASRGGRRNCTPPVPKSPLTRPMSASRKRPPRWSMPRWRPMAGIDILVNNVGGGGGGARIADSTDDDWRGALERNLIQTVRIMRLALPHMKGRPGAAIVNIASISGWSPQLAMSGQYGAAKAALIFDTERWVLEFVPHGIRVNTISPGSILVEGNGWDRYRLADCDIGRHDAAFDGDEETLLPMFEPITNRGYVIGGEVDLRGDFGIVVTWPACFSLSGHFANLIDLPRQDRSPVARDRT